MSYSDSEEEDEYKNCLKKILTLMEPFAIDETKRMSGANTMLLSTLLDRFFPEESYTIIGAFQRANSTTNLVTSGSNLRAQKQHLHEEEDWLLHFNVLNEIYSTLSISYFLDDCKYFPQLVHMSINAHTTRITTEFIPLSFQEIFTKNLPSSFIKQRIYELLTAVSLLHIKLNMAHRDIKPENIRFKSDGTLVLLDYDTCCSRKSNTWWTRPVCSEHTRAPELCIPTGTEPYNMSRYNGYATDIFSIGCVIYSMCLECKLPFVTEPQLLREEQIKNFANCNGKMKIINKIGEDGFGLLTQMLSFHPSQRPDISQCLAELA